MRNIFKNIAALGGVLVAVTGCGIDGVGDALSGGASMRIEIEVYKGPLSKEVDIQWGELTAIIREAQTSLATYDDDLLRVASTQGYLKQSLYQQAQYIFKQDAVLAIWDIDTDLYRVRKSLKALQEVIERIDESSKTSQAIKDLCKKYLDTIKEAEKRLQTTQKNYDEYMGKVYKFTKLTNVGKFNAPQKKQNLKIARTELTDKGRVFDYWARSIDGLSNFDQLGLASDSDLVMNVTDSKKSLKAANTNLQMHIVTIKEPFKKNDINAGNSFALEDSYMHGPLTVQPNYRGDIVSDRRKLPSRAVSHIHGRKVKMDAAEFFWCNNEEFRYGMSGNSNNANVFKARIGQECLRLAQIHDEVSHLHKIIHAFRTNNNKLLNNFFSNSVEDLQGKSLTTSLRWASEIGSRMKTKAMYWASAMMVAPQDRVSRTMVTAFAALAAEYGNQIASRADTLLKQCSGGACNPDIRKSLPLSVYLREINPTEFHNLFSYNRSGDFASKEEMLTRPIWSLGTEETVDRARAVEKLFADHNWSQINTVYASGRGDVNMAFVKDEIGNWNLKNFSNDPSELLEGYKQITVAAMKAAAELAKEGSGSGGALDLVSRLAQGKVGSGGQNASGVDLSSLSRTMELQIQEIVKRGKGYPDKKDFKIEDNAEVIGKVETVKQQLIDQLNDYQEMLEILEKSIVTAEDVQ